MDVSAKNDLPSGARQQLAWALADVYEYRVDMSRDLQMGDAFKVVAERSLGPTGAMRIGRVLAATFKLSGTSIDAVRFNSGSVSGDYFDQDGKSMRAAFLRAPLEFRRISSIFGMREHPILGGMRQHKGTDYAAASGTPVRAIGDGVVIHEGWGNGYGNMVEIRHRNGFVTRYGHLSRFSSNVRVGSRVTIGHWPQHGAAPPLRGAGQRAAARSASCSQTDGRRSDSSVGARVVLASAQPHSRVDRQHACRSDEAGVPLDRRHPDARRHAGCTSVERGAARRSIPENSRLTRAA